MAAAAPSCAWAAGSSTHGGVVAGVSGGEAAVLRNTPRPTHASRCKHPCVNLDGAWRDDDDAGRIWPGSLL